MANMNNIDNDTYRKVHFAVMAIESGAKKLWAKDIYSSAYSREVITRAQELRQELTQE